MKKWYHLSKGQSALLCLVVISPYLYYYHKYFGNNQYSLPLLVGCAIALLLHFFDYIEDSTRAEILIAGKSTKHFWEDGYCLVLSIFPILHYFRIRPLLSLRKKRTEPLYRADRDVSIDHYQNQKLPNYNVRVEATPFTMTMMRVIETLLGTFFNVEKGDPGLFYQRVGSRMLILVIILGLLANIFFPNKEVGSVGQMFSMVSEEKIGQSKEPRNGMTLVSSGLHVGMAPQMPLPENFVPRPTSTTRLYFNVDNGVDKRKYFLFHEPPLGKFHTITVTEPLCQVIPAGRDVLFFSKYRPQFEGNTENYVEYVIKKERQNPLRELYKNFRGTSSKTEAATWKEIYSDWSMVDTDNYGIIVRALPDKDQPQPGKGLGGIVCF